MNAGPALGLTLLAGIATGLGSAIAFFAKRTDFRFLALSTGFSAGVMLYVSFAEIMVKGGQALVALFGEGLGPWLNTASFFAGMGLMALVDGLIPAARNPHEMHSEQELAPLHDPAAPLPEFGRQGGWGDHDHRRGEGTLLRTGVVTALAIGVHNFPEGLATFLAALNDRSVGLAIAAAVALHNIPEGISVAVPIYYATGSRRRAFLYSLFSGLAEPVGALVVYGAFLLATGGAGQEGLGTLAGFLFGSVAGVMVYISLDELLPASRAFSKGHESIIGVAAGMLVMAVSLLVLK